MLFRSMEEVQIEKICLYRIGAKDLLDDNWNKTGVVRYVTDAERELELR